VNPKNPAWKYYGGRGIQFLFTSFENFWMELGPRPSPEHSLDRVIPNGPYSAHNCKWATRVEQADHKRGQWVWDVQEITPDIDDSSGEILYRITATMYF